MISASLISNFEYRDDARALKQTVQLPFLQPGTKPLVYERKNVKIRKIAAMTAAASLMLSLAACGDGSDDGEGSNTIDVYTHNEVDEMKGLVADAEEATGVEINLLRLSSNEGWSRVENEAPNFGADMQWGQLESLALRGVEEDYFEPYLSPTWDDIPDTFKDPEGRWYGWSYWFDLIAINTEVLEAKGLDKPTSWEDLADPQYKGEIILPDPGTSGTAYLMVSTILQIMGEDEGWDFFERLNKNVGQYTKSGTQPAQLVGQGEYGIGITWDQAVFDRIEEGYPMEAIMPEEGVGYSLDVVWMFKDTKNREAVEKVIDYIGSDEGMTSAANVRSMVTKPGFEGKTDIENLDDHFIDYDAVWADENQDDIMKKWRDMFGSIAE